MANSASYLEATRYQRRVHAVGVFLALDQVCRSAGNEEVRRDTASRMVGDLALDRGYVSEQVAVIRRLLPQVRF